jgi:type IV secretion system protein VirD4
VSAPSGWHPAEVACALFLGGALAVGLLLAATAGLAGLLFGDGWAAGSLADMPTVATRLPDHVGDPRAAWPAAVRPSLPGAAGFYVAFALVVAAMTLAGAAAARFSGAPRSPSSGWARARDLRPLRVSRAMPRRIVLGRHRGRLLAAEEGQSVLVVAPTQSGKTTALAVPAILEWEGPVIALSVKNDLLRDSISRRLQMGRVAVFDPTASTGLSVTSSWTPLLSCRNWSGARRVASWLCDAAAPNKRSLTDGDFWYSAAAKLLAPILYAAATAGLTMDEVIAWIDTQEERMVLAALEGTGCQPALDAMQANWSRDERQRSSIYTTAETVLEAYADPGVLERSRAPEIRADWFLDGGNHTLYICASAREQRRLRPVFVALLQEMLEAAYQRAGHRGGPLTPGLLVVLDEVANVAPLPDLDVLVSTGAGHGVQLLTILQDVAQAYDRWGRERADTIINNHRAKVLGAGLADERALDWAGRLLGEHAVDHRSVTSGETGRRSTTHSNQFRPLAPANVMRQARAGTGLLVYGNLAPAWIRLRPWYADDGLRRLAERLPDERS